MNSERHWLMMARVHAQDAHFHGSRARLMHEQGRPAAALLLEQQARDAEVQSAHAIHESAWAFEYQPPEEYYRQPDDKSPLTT